MAAVHEINEPAVGQVGRWLQRKLRFHCWLSLSYGLLCLVAGLITLAITSWGVAVITLLVLIRITTQHFQAVRPVFVISLLVAVVVLSFWEAWRNPFGFGNSFKAAHFPDRLSGGRLRALTAVFREILVSGPRMILAGLESFWECQQLLRTQLSDAAMVLLWMLERNHKVSVETLGRTFPLVNFVRLLSQLRVLDGFLWLPVHGGICILGSELRNELFSELGKSGFRSFEQPEASSPEAEPFRSEFEPGPEPEPEDSTSGERRWFEVLGLEPYVRLPEVKKRYRLLARKFHPDRHRHENVEAVRNAEERMKEINEAYTNICRRFREA
jgi:hypothetical protein